MGIDTCRCPGRLRRLKGRGQDKEIGRWKAMVCFASDLTLESRAAFTRITLSRVAWWRWLFSRKERISHRSD